MLSCLLCNFVCLYLSLSFLKIKERAAYPAHSSTPYSIKQKLKSKLNVPMTIISLRIEKVKKNKERTLVKMTTVHYMLYTQGCYYCADAVNIVVSSLKNGAFLREIRVDFTSSVKRRVLAKKNM